MRYQFILLITIFLSTISYGQTYEVGVMVGGTNYTGDVGSTSFVLPEDYIARKKFSTGLLFKWNRSTRHSFRFSVLRANTFGNDLNSDMNRRIARAYRFETEITEFSAGIEFTFWEWDPHQNRAQLVPYLYTGPTYFLANHFYEENGQLTKGRSNNNFAIPMVIGLKLNLSTHWVIGAEFGARYTFTDNLDGSNPSEFDSNQNFVSFGNPNTNDWYMFAGLTLTYSFGRKPCYCNF
ncbi:MAG: DUF6089 family protein [Bacteroidota bacterium]